MQLVRPATHDTVHIPDEQTSPALHFVPHAPQLATSLPRSRQTPAQITWPPPQVEAHLPAVHTSPTLQALLASRIDRLAEHERAVAQRGSVEGRLFHRGTVAALLPEPERPDVGAHLLSLVRKELIRPDRATLPGDDGSCSVGGGN